MRWRRYMLGMTLLKIASWHIDSVVPAMPLFKVFPQFGIMILGKWGWTADAFADSAASPTPAAHVVGWAYHFSNGMSFGIMYLALIGSAARRSWMWGIVMATGIEATLLLTPYAKTFGIPVTTTFVVVTMSAHVIFGAVMGLVCRRLATADAPMPASILLTAAGVLASWA